MAEPKVTINTVSTVVQVTDFGDGRFEYKEIPADIPPPVDLHSTNRRTFNQPIVLGLGVTGYYDIGDQTIGFYVTFNGSQVGPSGSAGLNTGVTIGVDLLLVDGSVTLKKSGTKLRLEWSLGSMGTHYGSGVDLLDI